MSRFGGGAKCPVCDKSVYFSDEVLAENNKYHKLCFKCVTCSKPLEVTSVAMHEDKIYCKPCHAEAVETSRAFNVGTATAGGGEATSGAGDPCPRCGGRVYMAEKIVGAGSSWHKSCFSCSECKKKLDSTTVCDNEGEIYCKGCYGKQFGPKGVGFGQGAGTLTTT